MKVFSADEVAQHKSADSCWVVLYGNVYDVTSFLPSHPGGSKIILQLAGGDATEDYDPVHPPGTLEENLSPAAKLGSIDPESFSKQQQSQDTAPSVDGEIDVQSLLNLDELEAVAKKKISLKGWAYYYSASDDLYSKRLNTLAYRSILFRPRVFVDVNLCSTTTSFFGHAVQTPIYVSPAAMARLANPAGEAGIAAACAKFGATQIISQNASQTPEQIVADAKPDQVFGWQLYVQTERKKSETMLARINKLKPVQFLVLTLDAPVPGKREDDERVKSVSNPNAKAAVQQESSTSTSKAPAGAGLGAALFWGTAADLTWQTTMPWLVQHTQLPIVLKGVQTHEDAALALQHPQVKGIILSNHGGRALDTAPPAMHTLLEIRKFCPEVLTRLEVFVDGGVKRGTDVVKALCLGARGVGIGRAALYGLGVGGQAGVERTLEILQAEVVTAMKLLGVQRLEDLGPQCVNTRALERDIYDGPAGLGSQGLWLAKL